MGQALIEAALALPDVVLAAALDVAGSPALGRDAGERFGRATGVIVGADVPAALRGADVLIDFTRPDGTLAHVAACAAAGVGAVVGTTGLNDSAEGRPGRACASPCRSSRGEHERRRGRPAVAGRTGRGQAGSRLRRRNRRNAPPAQGRRAVGHRAAVGRGRRGRQRAASSRTAPCTRAKATRASARRARSDSRRCGAATSSASTRWSSRAPASASSCPIARRRGRISRAARCAQPCSSPAKRAAGQAGLYDMQDVLGLR